MDIGIDILDRKRIKLSNNLVNRVLSKEELELFLKINNKKNKKRFFATIWTSKEAIFKTGVSNFSYKNFTILHNKLGKPYCKENDKIILSVSHEKRHTICIAILK